MTTELNFDNWNRNAAKFVQVLGVNAERVVKYETGQLLQTLIRVTPPKEPAKARQRITKRIKSMFGLAKTAGDDLGKTAGSFFGNYLDDRNNSSGSSPTSFKIGSTGVEWFAATPKTLYGVTTEADRRGDSVAELERLSYTLTPKGRSTYSFRKSKRNQKIRIIRNILTDPKKVILLAKKLAGNVGRMKAGWLIAWDALGTAQRSVPAYITKHRSGAKGGYVNSLSVPGSPSFTIINKATAVGKTNAKQGWLNKAVAMRAKAMATNFSMIFNGRKELSDYAKL